MSGRQCTVALATTDLRSAGSCCARSSIQDGNSGEYGGIAETCPLAPIGSASFRLLSIGLQLRSRLPPPVGRPSAVAPPSVRRDQLTAGLLPARARPCWAHTQKAPEA